MNCSDSGHHELLVSQIPGLRWIFLHTSVTNISHLSCYFCLLIIISDYILAVHIHSLTLRCDCLLWWLSARSLYPSASTLGTPRYIYLPYLHKNRDILRGLVYPNEQISYISIMNLTYITWLKSWVRSQMVERSLNGFQWCCHTNRRIAPSVSSVSTRGPFQ